MTIVPMAVATVLVTAATAVWLLRHLAGGDPRCSWLLCCGLGSSALVNLLVKRPLAEAVASAGGTAAEVGAASPVWFLAFALLLPPVTEETVKALPALLPRVRDLARRDRLLTGLALGTGFGIGEAAFVAWTAVRGGDHAGTAWWAFSGFAVERLFASLGHGVMTAVVLWGFGGPRRRRVLGFAAAVGLHTLLNLGAFIDQVAKVPPRVLALWFPAGLLLLGAVFEALRCRAAPVRGTAGHDGRWVSLFRTDDRP
ncbi:PrsW family glutamic-type intramembrane protease [Streptomyces sp. NPDC057611]|uniref:PrsW family glutamic-type intramembrane protease n=1 Tax=Streptomyces sp. NPDC057611 TaxID=3346182 RepID=UPI00369205C7